MANTARHKTAAIKFSVPQSMTEANKFIERIGVAQRLRQNLETKMSERIAKVKSEYEEKAAGLKKEIEERTDGVQTYCAANRDDLTKKGKIKTYKFPAGVVNWRSRPAKVTIRGVDAVIELLKEKGLKAFLRTAVTINKEAMLTDKDTAATVKGVSIGSGGEDFVVTPMETKLEQVATGK